jgi:hypothetical protein
VVFFCIYLSQFYIKDIQFTELNNHVGWTIEIIYVDKAGHVYITFHTGLGGKHNHLCSFKGFFLHIFILSNVLSFYPCVTCLKQC